jgi:uncharacterized protein
MENNLYEKEIICPVCAKKFMTTKVKAKGCKVATRESDFCVRYEETNPLMYDVWVCENCGYAAQSDRFENITEREVKLVRQHVSSKWSKRSFAGERNLDTSIETFKLALINAHIRNVKPNELARLCLRIAWMYRFKGEEDREKEFLKHALKNYLETYEKERFPVEKMDEYTCLYMIAELNHRVGNLADSARWFGRLITNPDASRMNRTIIEAAREQYGIVKELLKNTDSDTAAGGQA